MAGLLQLRGSIIWIRSLKPGPRSRGARLASRTPTRARQAVEVTTRPKCRAKNRTALSASNLGSSLFLRPSSRATSSPSRRRRRTARDPPGARCAAVPLQVELDRDGDLLRFLGQGIGQCWPKTAAVVSIATNGMPIAVPMLMPQKPAGPSVPISGEFLEGIQGRLVLGHGEFRQVVVVAHDDRAFRLARRPRPEQLGDFRLVVRRARPVAVTGRVDDGDVKAERPVTRRWARPDIAGCFLWLPPP